MPTPSFQSPQGQQTAGQLQDFIVKLIRDLNFMLGNLDTLNVNRLDAKVIIAASIIAGKLAADSVETDNLQAGAVTANKITVAQLSAIAADLGTITAGIIYGAYIATVNGTYPRVEMSNTDNLFAAYVNANQSIKISPVYSGSPSILFYDGGAVKANMAVPTGGGLGITTSGAADITLQSAANLNLDPTSSLKINGLNGFAGTVYVSSTSGGVANVPITFTKGIRTS